jgi:predicted amidohydrolase
MQRFTVAATQIDVHYQDLEHNLQAHLDTIQEVANAGCHLVLFPELGVTGHNATPDITQFAEPADGRIFQTIQAEAKACRIFVSYGFMEQFRGTHYNTQALVGPDGRVGLQRKMHASLDEFFRFRQAYEWHVYDIGFCKIGTAICHDSDFWESWRILALMGAEVILLPHAIRKMTNEAGDLIFDGHAYDAPDAELFAAQRAMLEARPNPKLHDIYAQTNGVFAVFSDHVGFDGHSTHVGCAYVIDPTGKLIAKSKPARGHQWISAELDPSVYDYVRRNPWFQLKKRRPEVYGELSRLL